MDKEYSKKNLRQIKSRSDLPNNFSIDAYKSSNLLSDGDWVVNLEQRAMTGFILSNDYFRDEWISRASYIFERPILTLKNAQKFIATSGLTKFIDVSGVKDFTGKDFWWHGRENETDDRQIAFTKGFAEFFDGSNDYESARKNDPDLLDRMDMPYYALLQNGGIYNEGNVVVKVDLHRTDAHLMQDFASWLAKTRDATGVSAPKRGFTPSDFSRWSTARVLAFLDLTMWARAHGAEITQQLLGATLFPDEYDVNLAEQVRKKVAPLARSLVSEVMIDALRAQAIARLAEEKNGEMLPPKFYNGFPPDNLKEDSYPE